MTILQRLAALPRSSKWALAAAAAMLLYFVAVEPLIDLGLRLHQRADARLALLRSQRATEVQLASARTAILQGLRKHGSVEFPPDGQVASVTFNKAVDDILRTHNVGEQTSTSRSSPLGAGPLARAVPQDRRVERLIRDINFQAEPEAVSAVVADLERSPAVTTISRFQVRVAENRDRTSRAVRASITVEAWVLEKKGRS